AVDNYLIAKRAEDVPRFYNDLTSPGASPAACTANNSPTVQKPVMTAQFFEKVILILREIGCTNELSRKEMRTFQPRGGANRAAMGFSRDHIITSPAQCEPTLKITTGNSVTSRQCSSQKITVNRVIVNVFKGIAFQYHTAQCLLGVECFNDVYECVFESFVRF